MRRLTRSRTNRFFAGVCGGLGEFFNIDATLIRIIVVVLAIPSLGSLLLAYLIAMVIIPLEH